MKIHLEIHVDNKDQEWATNKVVEIRSKSPEAEKLIMDGISVLNNNIPIQLHIGGLTAEEVHENILTA